jgi:hypothetical protein
MIWSLQPSLKKVLKTQQPQRYGFSLGLFYWRKLRRERNMKYSIIVDRGADKYGYKNYRPLFTANFKGRHPLYLKRERPKIMKRLLKTVKRTKGQITSVRSVFDANGRWMKIIQVQ